MYKRLGKLSDIKMNLRTQNSKEITYSDGKMPTPSPAVILYHKAGRWEERTAGVDPLQMGHKVWFSEDRVLMKDIDEVELWLSSTKIDKNMLGRSQLEFWVELTSDISYPISRNFCCGHHSGFLGSILSLRVLVQGYCRGQGSESLIKISSYNEWHTSVKLKVEILQYWGERYNCVAITFIRNYVHCGIELWKGWVECRETGGRNQGWVP